MSVAASVAGFLQESDFKILLIYGISHTNPKLVYQITTCTGSPPSYLPMSAVMVMLSIDWQASRIILLDMLEHAYGMSGISLLI